MESKKRMRRTIIWKRSNGSKRIQRKRDANNNNNNVDLRDAFVSIICSAMMVTTPSILPFSTAIAVGGCLDPKITLSRRLF
ncbi:unnamed protein product [Camellia sinensis]